VLFSNIRAGGGCRVTPPQLQNDPENPVILSGIAEGNEMRIMEGFQLKFKLSV
jgi:hypothetical protein